MVRIGGVREYVGLLKLRIAALLLLVAVAGFVVASGTAAVAIDVPRLAFLIGSGLLAASGSSAMNSYFDRDIDGLMSRTRHRALPQRRIAPPWKVFAFGATLSAGGVAMALFALNALTAAFIALGAFVYLVVYTVLLKRRNVWNIVIGGFAGSCPALAGSAAAIGAVSVPAALLGLLVFLWTPGHFWSLAFRERADYRRAGLPMLPAMRDEGFTVRAITASTAITVAAAVLFLLSPSFGIPYVLVAAASGAIVLGLTVRFAREPNERTAWVGYKASSLYLGVVLVGAIADALLRIPA